jgi:hypothetical protein
MYSIAILVKIPRVCICLCPLYMHTPEKHRPSLLSSCVFTREKGQGCYRSGCRPQSRPARSRPLDLVEPLPAPRQVSDRPCPGCQSSPALAQATAASRSGVKLPKICCSWCSPKDQPSWCSVALPLRSIYCLSGC